MDAISMKPYYKVSKITTSKDPQRFTPSTCESGPMCLEQLVAYAENESVKHKLKEKWSEPCPGGIKDFMKRIFRDNHTNDAVDALMYSISMPTDTQLKQILLYKGQPVTPQPQPKFKFGDRVETIVRKPFVEEKVFNIEQIRRIEEGYVYNTLTGTFYYERDLKLFVEKKRMTLYRYTFEGISTRGIACVRQSHWCDSTFEHYCNYLSNDRSHTILKTETKVVEY
jgi:hypothetical protein